MSGHSQKQRLGKSDSKDFDPAIQNTPDLPAIDFGAVGQQAPVLRTRNVGGHRGSAEPKQRWLNASDSRTGNLGCAAVPAPALNSNE